MVVSLLDQARAIVWAQWRSILNFYPRSNKFAGGFTMLLTLLWYGAWTVGSIYMASRFASLTDFNRGQALLASELSFGFFYWQVVPLMLASAGMSLEMKKLIVYPVPHSQLFLLDVLLRISTGLEMLILLTGTAAGIVLNPKLAWWCALPFLPYLVFNLAFAASVRELLSRVMARRYWREIAMLLMVMVGALPQFIIMAGDRLRYIPGFQSLPALGKGLQGSGRILPWAPVSELAMGHFALLPLMVLLGWTVAALVFGRSQFERGLRFDVASVQAAPRQEAAPARWSEWLYSLPGRILPDPLAAMMEKEYRSLARSPRFRLVFFMGFTFGLLLWLPMLTRSPGSFGFFHDNYLTFVAVYALLLLGEVCLWNIFGFDRSAAQAYLVMPVKLRTALIAKNLVALTFVLLEVTIVAMICKVLRLPLSLGTALPAYLICLLMTFTLMCAGNLTSVYYPRPVNPKKTMRSSPGARTQGLLMLIFVVAAGMSGLAYLAEYAFDSRVAFYGVICLQAAIVGITYSVALDSAVEAAFERREQMISALSQNETPVSA